MPVRRQDGQFVPVDPEPEQAPDGDVAEITVVSKRLPRKGIAEMPFDEGQGDREQSASLRAMLVCVNAPGRIHIALRIGAGLPKMAAILNLFVPKLASFVSNEPGLRRAAGVPGSFLQEL
jgi:hypothetical protein